MEDELKRLIDKCNRLKDYDTANLVLITREDIEEIVREITPYTMKKLDDLDSHIVAVLDKLEKHFEADGQATHAYIREYVAELRQQYKTGEEK